MEKIKRKILSKSFINITMKEKIFYRFEERKNPATEEIEVELLEFKIYKETKKGYWVFCEDVSNQMFVPKSSSRKNFAFETKEDALNVFLFVKNRQLENLKEKMFILENAINVAKNLL